MLSDAKATAVGPIIRPKILMTNQYTAEIWPRIWLGVIIIKAVGPHAVGIPEPIAWGTSRARPYQGFGIRGTSTAALDEQNLNKVFDPFFTTKSRGGGTGLGLSVVAGLVREWGGAIDVKRVPGATVFTVYVPLAEAERQAAE
jgi:hypothetical protein